MLESLLTLQVMLQLPFIYPITALSTEVSVITLSNIEYKVSPYCLVSESLSKLFFPFV